MAFAYHVALGDDPERFLFNQSEMRPHLIRYSYLAVLKLLCLTINILACKEVDYEEEEKEDQKFLLSISVEDC